MSVLERCPYKRGHYDDVTFITPLTVLRVQFSKTRFTLAFKLHLNLLIQNTKTLSFSSIQHCTNQLQSSSRTKISLAAGDLGTSDNFKVSTVVDKLLF